MLYRTGRKKTLIWSINLSGTIYRTVDNRRGPFPYPEGVIPTPLHEATWYAKTGGCQATVTPYYEAVPDGDGTTIRHPGDPYTVRYGVKIELSGIMGDQPNPTGYALATFNIPEDSVTMVSYDVDLTVNISIPVEEVLSVEVPEGASTIPWHGGVPDAPLAYWAVLSLMTFGDTGSITCGATGITGPTTVGFPMPVWLSVIVTSRSYDGGSGSASLSTTSSPCVYTASASFSPSRSEGPPNSRSASVNVGSGSVSVSTTSTASPAGQEKTYPPSDATGIGIWYGDKAYNLSGVVRSMENAYPDTMDIFLTGHVVGGMAGNTISTSNGSFAASGVQLNWSLGAILNGVNYDDIHNEHAVFACTLTSAKLAANGDDDRATRCALRGKVLPGIAISQASSFDLDTASDSTVWSGSGVSVSGGVVTLSGETTAIRSFTPAVSALPYRYLRIRVRSAGADEVPLIVAIPPCSVEIDNAEYGGGSVDRTDTYTGPETPNKTWSVTTGADGVWKDIDIDLCAPDNIEDETDNQDTRWPTPTRMPRYFGVWRMEKLQIAFTASNSETVEIDSVQFVRHGATKWDFLPTFYRSKLIPTSEGIILDSDWPIKYRPDEILDADTLIEYFARRWLLSNCDGRQGAEEADLTYTKVTIPENAPQWSFFMPSIEGIKNTLEIADPHTGGSIVRYPGVTAEVLAPVVPTGTPPDPADYPPAADWYYNRSLPAVFLGGGGALYSAGEWHYSMDTAGSVLAQPFYDVVDWYPGCGDAFGHGGGFGDAIVLKAAAILRASGHGMALVDVDPSENNRHYEPLEGDDVLLLQDGISRGTAITDASGYFQTDVGDGALSSPTAPPFTIERFAQDPARVITVSAPWNRHRHRAVYLGPIISRPCTDRLFLGGAIFDPFTDPAPERLSRLLPYQQWRIVAATGTVAEKDQAGE